MPLCTKTIRAAHAANDRAVLAAYGLKSDTPEPEIVAHLFKLYAEMTAKDKKPHEKSTYKIATRASSRIG